MISGILIILFWLFVVAELVKRKNFNQNGVDVTFIHKNRSLEKPFRRMERDFFKKGVRLDTPLQELKAIKDIFDVREEIFLTVNLMGSTQEILSSTKGGVR